jgi:glycosyltransferase involved in cell wall biosynthesis
LIQDNADKSSGGVDLRPIVIYPPTVDWDYLHQRPQQLLKTLARCGCISIFCNMNMNQKHPAGFEFCGEHLILANNVELQAVVQWVKANYTSYPIVIYYSWPVQVNLVKTAGADLVIFDSLDEPVNEFAHWLPSYESAVRIADIVIASANSLAVRASQLCSDTVTLIPNGCDYEHFKMAQAKQTIDEMPFDTDKPVLGYIGSVATWLDWQLIELMVTHFADCEFVFIGPKCMQVNLVANNLHFLGHKDYENLPKYLSNFTLCLIPHLINDTTKGMSPIKFWDYLASGTPVASTNLPNVNKKFVRIIDRTNFTDVLFEESPMKRQERIKYAEANSWQSRAGQLWILIYRGLGYDVQSSDRMCSARPGMDSE